MSLGESAFNRDARQDAATDNYLTLSQIAVGGIASASDKDWYEVYLVAGVNYAAAWVGQAYGGNPALANATMTLRNASGTAQPATKTTSANGGGIGFQVATSGKYYIEMDGTAATDVGTYLIQLGRTFTDDYGSNFADGGQIKTGVPVKGALQTAADNDAFVLSVTAGSRYFYYVTTSVPDLAYTLDTTSLQRAGFGFLTNGQFGEVTATVTTTALLSVFSDSYVGTGAYTLFAEKAYSTDRILKIDTTGVNSYTGTTAAEEIWGFGGNDNFNGGGGNDILVGGVGDDTLNGGVGADKMIGGGGNDTYLIDNVGDTIVETATTGSTADIAKTAISYSLAPGVRVENFQTTNAAGTGAINLNGNEVGQTITGNAGANTIRGKGGADTIKGLGGNDILKGDGDAPATGDGADNLQGGAGNDSLYGGRGNDTLRGDDNATQRGLDKFYFDTVPNGSTNRDTILDFNPVDDAIYLKKSGVFAGIPTLGTLSAAAFKQIDNYNPASPGARTSVTDDYRIIYDKVSGKLYYDADGHGGSATAVLFAIVNNGTAHPTLTNADFIVY